MLVDLRDAGGLELAEEIYRETARLGGQPMIAISPGEAVRTLADSMPIEELATTPRLWLEALKASDVVIIVFSPANTRVFENVNSERMSIRDKAVGILLEEQLKKRWNFTIHPTNALAQEAGMSLREYQDFAYSAMLRDWKSEVERMTRLKEIMDRTDHVRLTGKDTDLSFSIKDRIAIIDDAKRNLPGGEVYVSPVDGSAEGRVFFNLPAQYAKELTDIRLTFAKGEIVDYSASKNEDYLRQVIETDTGSKRLGEFGIGTNRGIDRFTKNMLFDEKLAGTIHLAIGQAFEESGGHNKSAVHYDFIKTMKPGEITMDGRTIQKDGKFLWE